jgi:hypothetical protein
MLDHPAHAIPVAASAMVEDAQIYSQLRGGEDAQELPTDVQYHRLKLNYE